MNTAPDILDAVDELERSAFKASLAAQDNLRDSFDARGLPLTYGETRSFDIARYEGVTPEQFASLPDRDSRMKWLNERRAKLARSNR